MSTISVTIDGRTFTVEVSIPPGYDGTELTAHIDGEPVQVALPTIGSPEQLTWVVINHRSYEITIDHELSWIRSRSGRHQIDVRDAESMQIKHAAGTGRIKAPIPGIIKHVLIERGSHVTAGQPLIVLEAMKMENEIRAPRDGVIVHLNVTPGQIVTLQEVMIEID